MATYDGVKVETYTVREVEYLRLWWYTGQGSERRGKSIGAAEKLTKAQIAHARKAQEAELAQRPELIKSRDEAPTIQDWMGVYKSYRPDATERNLDELEATHVLLVEFFGQKKKLDQVDRRDVAEFRAWLQTRCKGRDGGAPAPATVAKHIRHASNLFGVEHGAAKYYPAVRNPFEGERMNEATETRGHPELSEDDVAALVAAAPDHQGKCVIAICAYAGLRLGEALALQWSDIAWEKNRLTATATKKTGDGKGKRREVRLEPALARVLLSAHEAEPKLASPCADLHWRSTYDRMRSAWAGSGVAEWDDPFQALRRRRDVLWKAAGYPEYVVDAWMGHSMAVSRKHYLRPPEGMYAEAGVAKAGQADILSDLTGAELDQVRVFVEDLKKRRNIGATSESPKT